MQISFIFLWSSGYIRYTWTMKKTRSYLCWKQYFDFHPTQRIIWNKKQKKKNNEKFLHNGNFQNCQITFILSVIGKWRRKKLETETNKMAANKQEVQKMITFICIDFTIFFWRRENIEKQKLQVDFVAFLLTIIFILKP